MPFLPAGDITPPNIVVIVIDDIGMDQMSFPPFGWDAAPEAPSLPVMAEIAQSGVSFRNFWATPECSPSRAAMLTGRHGIRTQVVTALVDPMLPFCQLHPSEITVPELLGEAGYRTAMVGKYHLGGSPENAPPGYGYEAPVSTTGLDFYDGYWDLPPAADTTLGGQAPDGTFDCGSIGGIAVTGAACFPNGTCVEGIHPLQAMAMGATPLLDAKGELAQSCADGDCTAIDFSMENAYYVWPRTLTTPLGYIHPDQPQREYLTEFISRRSAAVSEQLAQEGHPWLLFCTHSSAHTPIQPPPPSLTGPAASGVSCDVNGGPVYRLQYKLMAESLDRSIGKMLVEMGLGSWDNGEFVLGDLTAANTMIVLLDDNGSLGYNVLPPFSAVRAKQTVYESGVRVACVVAGPQVASPGRAVDDAVSVVDLFGLLCDAGGVDWESVESPSRRIDCVPMMPYLTNPDQGAIREFNFTLYRQGTFAPGDVGPCIIGQTVVDGLMTSQALCESNGGCWAGGSATAPFPVTNYCDLMSTDPENAVFDCGSTIFCTLPPVMQDLCASGTTPLAPPTIAQYAMRRGQWKLVVRQLPECLAPNDCEVRIYHLNQPDPPTQPGIELQDGQPGVWDPLGDDLPPPVAAEYEVLRSALVELFLSQPNTPADGNLDGVVDGADLAGLLGEWGSMGFWDANKDGVVDAQDLAELLASWGDDPSALGQVPDCLLEGPDTLVRDYGFEGGYEDATGSGIAAQPMGGVIEDGSYVFGFGQGLRVPVSGLDLSDFEIRIEMTLSGQQIALGKLIDMTNLTEDRGFYRTGRGSLFQFLPPFSPMSEDAVPLGTPVVVTLARDGATHRLSASINGVEQWTMEDPLGLAVPPTDGFLTFFVDDTVTGSLEMVSGRVSRISIFSGN